MPRPTFRAPLRQSSGRPRTAHSLSALGIELHGLVSYPEALALAQARSFLRLHPSFDSVLIMNLEQTRIRDRHRFDGINLRFRLRALPTRRPARNTLRIRAPHTQEA